MALKAALNGVRAKFGTGGIRAGVKRADKVLDIQYIRVSILHHLRIANVIFLQTYYHLSIGEIITWATARPKHYPVLVIN